LIYNLAPSQDTFSIVAVNLETGEVGSAGASCIAGSIIISDIHPGVGAIHTQSYWNSQNQAAASYRMGLGLSPQEIIDWLVENDAQNNPTTRQYGIVDLYEGGRSAAFTGENCYDYKNHITGPTYAIQGNILLGQEILDNMESAFLSFGTFEEKLMASLIAANVPGADTRCLEYGIPALSAFIRVAKPDDESESLFMDFNVNSVPVSVNPIDSLFTEYWSWKQSQFTLGDIDYNRKADVIDILHLVDFIEENNSPSDFEFIPADLNGNGQIEITDLYLLLYEIIGTIGSL